ncbi:ATP-binding protein [Microbacteriaceae bacterium 4G12]
MEQVRDLLIQISIIILPLFLYETIRLNSYHTTPRKPNPYLVTFFFSVTVLFCMTYSIKLGTNYQYDFHQIPITSAFLYGGPIGVFTALVSIIYSWFLYGTDSILPRFLSIFILSIFSLLLSKKWNVLSKNQKIISSFTLASFYALLEIVSSEITTAISPVFAYYIVAALTMAVTMTVQIYLTEYLYENALLRVEMQKSEKLNIVSELAASVAHEVRNPLTVVRGFIQLLQGTSDIKNREYMYLVLAELDRAEQIISDYLNLARPQIEKKEYISLSSQLIEMQTLMASFAAMRGVYLQVDIASNLYTIGDKVKLKQAIMNIVKNGIEAIQENKGYLKVIAVQEGDQIIIKVKDNGIGMTKDQLARLGQPYYSLKEKGTGLGLMVTFRIIQAHNGKVTYKSNFGAGTEATITLPAAPKAST